MNPLTHAEFLGVCQTVYTGHTAAVTRVRFSPDGSKIASAARDGTVRVWRSDGSEAPEVPDGAAETRTASPPSFFSRLLRSKDSSAPSGGAVSAPTADGAIRNVDSVDSVLASGVAGLPRGVPVVTRCAVPLSSCLSSGEVLSLAWHPHQEGWLLMGTADARLKLWSASARRYVFDLDVALGTTTNMGPPATPSKDKDKEREKERERERDREQKAARDRDSMDSAAVGFAECPRVLDAAFSPNPNDNLLVTAAASKYQDTLEGGKGVLCSWALQPSGAKRLRVFPIDASRTQVNSVVFNHNGNMLVTGGADGFVRVFDMASSSPLMGWPAHDGQVSCVRFSGDETTIVSCGVDGWVVEWSLHRIGKRLRSYRLPDSEPNAKTRFPVTRSEIALDPHGPHLLSSGPSSGRCGFLFNMAEPATAAQSLPGHSAAVLSVDWHGSAATCVTGGADHLLCVTRFSALVPRTQP